MESLNFPNASVIVVGYNSRQHLEQCFNALLNQTYPETVEILFIDNASTDGSAGHVREVFPTVCVVESGANLGYAAGNNLGSRLATGQVVAFLNPDTRPDPDWLVELVRPLLVDPSVGATTSKLVYMDTPEQINACGNELSLTGITTCRRMNELSSTVDQDEDITAVSGAAFATWAWLFRDLGRFDESFWMYLEDTDFSWRVRRSGYRCVLAAGSVVKHEYSFSLSPTKTLLVERNRYRMLSKNLDLTSIVALVPLFLLGEMLTWGWALLRGRQHIAAKVKATWWFVTNLKVLWRTNRYGGGIKVVSDAQVLRSHRGVPPITAIAGGVIGHVIAMFVVPLAIFMTMIVFVFVRDSVPVVSPTPRSSGV